MFCGLFGYSKQAYYKRDHRRELQTVERFRARMLVLGVRRQMPRLGTRKLYYLLKDRLDMGRDKLFDLLRDEGLLVARRRRYTVTTDSRHWMRKYPNLVKDMELGRPEQVWVADITYIDTAGTGHAYLHLVTDAYSKRIMGHELCDNMEAASTLKALRMAIGNREYKKLPLIHHSDRGLQYCSKLYTDCFGENNITVSMTENGDPYENAVAERVNGILKDEFGLDQRLDDVDEAVRHSAQSIHIYNNHRPHLSCHMLTPVQMHQQKEIRLRAYRKKTQTPLVDV